MQAEQRAAQLKLSSKIHPTEERFRPDSYIVLGLIYRRAIIGETMLLMFKPHTL